jgi:outer membrane protein assembly factor BamA
MPNISFFMNKYLISFLFCTFSTILWTQNTDSLFKPKPKLLALPIAFYTPDTKWGGGVSGVSTFFAGRNAPRSSVTIGLAATQLRQILVYLPFQIYTKNDDYRVFGEVGYFKYIFRFHGIGNEISANFEEKYSAKFPRLRLNWMKRFSPKILAGIKYSFDDYNITKTTINGVLSSQKPTGWSGGRISSVGLIASFDTRDNVYFPKKGYFFTLFGQQDDPKLGSNFRFGRVSLDAAGYFSTSKKSVLAIRFVEIQSWGDVPFFELSLLGGTKRLRGHFEGKYRDRNLALLETEWRFSIWRRFGGVVFSGLGSVFGQKNESAKLRPNAGAGLRFMLDTKQKLNIRADYGVGLAGNHGFYLTFGEAF